MGYSLEAVIATEPVLCELVGSVRQASIVPLGQRLSLLLMRDEFFDAITVVGAPALDGFWKAPAGFGNVLAACSACGPVAYVKEPRSGTVVCDEVRQGLRDRQHAARQTPQRRVAT
jgi:hypothetical protein